MPEITRRELFVIVAAAVMTPPMVRDAVTGISIRPVLAFHPKAFEFVMAPLTLDTRWHPANGWSE